MHLLDIRGSDLQRVEKETGALGIDAIGGEGLRDTRARRWPGRRRSLNGVWMYQLTDGGVAVEITPKTTNTAKTMT